MTEESFYRLQTIMTEAGELTKTVPFNDIVITEYSNEIYLKITDK